MDKEAQVSLLMHAKVMEYRITQMQKRPDLPPIVRLRIQGPEHEGLDREARQRDSA
jgi:hypothetical protein